MRSDSRKNGLNQIFSIVILYTLVLSFSIPAKALAGITLPGAAAGKKATHKPEAAQKDDSGQTSESPVYFEQNLGQFDEKVRFRANGPGYSLYLTADTAVYVISEKTPAPADPKSKTEKSQEGLPGLRNQDLPERSTKAVAIFMKIVGADENALMEGTQMQSHKVNYFKGNDPDRWQKDVPNFGRVRYENIYEGIDLEFYGKETGEIEHDFIVKPNADYRQVELQFEGAENLEIDSNGNLLIDTGIGQIKQSAPFSFQNTDSLKNEVESGYKLSDGNRVKFEVGDYDKTKELVIDPVLNNLAYSTFLGGNYSDYGLDIEVDHLGNTYIAGKTRSPSFPTTPGTFDTSINGDADAFVTKLSANGNKLIYSTLLGSGSDDSADSFEIDPSGNVYLAGTTKGGVHTGVGFPTTVGSFDTIYNGGFTDAFVTKINPQGNGLVYSTFVGGASEDYAAAIDIDIFGVAFVCGKTLGNDYPTTSGAFDTSYNGSGDGVMTVINSTGTNLNYSTFIGGTHVDSCSGIAIDSADNVYLTGTTQSIDFPTTAGAFDTTLGGDADGFVWKLNVGNNNLGYSTFIGGSGLDFNVTLTIDSQDKAYVTGITDSSDFPTTHNCYNTTINGGDDVFITKLGLDGTYLEYSTYLGGDFNEIPSGIKVDSSFNAFVYGRTESAAFPITTNAFDPVLDGESDGFITKLSSDGRFLQYSTFFGSGESSLYEGASALTLDSSENVYVTGSTEYSDIQLLPTTNGAYQTQMNSLRDAYVTKFGNFAITGRTLDENGSPIQDVHIALSGQNSENKFSDGDGNFSFLGAIPNTSYSVSATSAGTIFNPSIFNIFFVDSNRELLFIGGGSPTGGGGGQQFNFNVSNYTERESRTFAEVKVWRGGTSLTDRENLVGTATVDFATSSGTASSGTDYTDINGTLTFADGEYEKTFVVPINDDLTSENDETINLALSNPTGGAVLGNNSNAVLTIEDNNEPAMQTSGYQVEIVSSANALKGKHLAGMAVDSTDGTIYFAADSNVINAPAGQINNCGTELYQDSFELFKLATNGTISTIGTYSIRHRGLINLEFNPADGEIYTADTSRKVHRINPANGQINIHNSDVGFDTDRFGLQFDGNGDLIMMAYGSGNSFYRVPGGSGSTFVGNYSFDNTNFGDRFGIQPDGDYIVYSDASHHANARDFEIDTTGHTDGQAYDFSYISNNNIRVLGSSWMASNGAVNPVNGDVFTSGGNCAAGSSVILRTPLSGSPLMMNDNTQFINNIGNGQSNGAENFNARGVTDLEFGPKRNGQPGVCLYFLDDFNDVIYQACNLAPTAASVDVRGQVLTASGDRAIPGAVVSMTDADGNTRTSRANHFGFYRFDQVQAGSVYSFTVSAKGYQFETQVLNLVDEVLDFDFRSVPE